MYLPIITAQNQSAPENQAIWGSSFIGSVYDPNGLSITSLDFRDDGGDGGHFVLNGVVQPDGQWITVSVSQLSSFIYVAGSTPGSENVDVAAWDGYNWSYYATATETTYPTALPVIAAQSQSVLSNQAVYASSFIKSVSDPNNLAITYYDFRDEGGDGGYFALNGVVQPDGTWITVSASQLSSLVYVGAPYSGSESIDVAAWDGYNWSYYDTATATTLQAALPVITAQNQSVNENQAIAASSFIKSVSDPNNYAITYYDFRDEGNDGGHFVLNGVAQADGTWITVSSSQLANLYYVGAPSPGSETIDAAAWDGYNWSHYETASATTLAVDLPIIKVQNRSVDVNASIGASSFIASVSDPSNFNLPMVSYDFRDDGGDGGYFSLNGVKQADGTWITVSNSQLTNLVYVGAPAAGSENIDVAAWDGYNWSYYQTALAITNAVLKPAVTVQNQTVNTSAPVAASSFINSVNDPNNYAITSYEFRDDGGDGGYFTLNGVKQADNSWIQVSAANLANLLYTGGSASGSESIDVAAYNGHIWSDAQTATAITKASQYVNPPVVKVQNQTVAENGSIQASSLIASVSDSNNYAITEYEFRDDGGGGGYFQLDSIPQSAGTWITVSASDLANMIYVGGTKPAAETVDIAVWDGHAWSNTQTATITTQAPQNTLPVIAAANQSVNANASIYASSFIASVSDPNNYAITQYDFRDEGNDGGYFSLNGVKQANGTWTAVSASNLSALTYVGAPSAGSEKIDVAAWDSVAWSNYQTATATTAASSAPVVKAQNQSVAANASIQASTLIGSVTDPNDYTITNYQFRDDDNDGGYFSLNGVKQADNSWISVSASNLANLTYVGAPSAGSETIDFEVYDGHSWSASASATVTTTGGSAVNPVIAKLNDAGIKADVTAGLSNNTLSYSAMLKILQDAANGGDTATKFADLKTLVANFNKANSITVTPYLYYISNALINGDAANQYWTGGQSTSIALGNLTASSTQTQMNELIQKWFLGGDLPSLVFDSAVSCSYQADTDPLYNSTGLPAVSDINQGFLGDCYLLASMADVAQDQPALLKSLITNNGNNTYGVEFYINSKSVYVTVDNEFPYKTGTSSFVANTSPDLWSCLIEKAYVQLNADPGYLNHTSGDAWKLIENGGGDPITQLTGKSYSTYNSQGYTLTNWAALKNTIVSAIQSGQEVDLGSFGSTYNGNTKLFIGGVDAQGNLEGHMYSALGYDSKTGEFIIRNPWGAESGQNWATEFEATMSDFYNVRGELFVANGSTAADPSAVVAPNVIITSTGSLTAQTAQTITGTIDTADAGLPVSIYDGATLIAGATPDSNGNWSATVTLSGNGLHSITASAINASGQTGTSTPLLYILVPTLNSPVVSLDMDQFLTADTLLSITTVPYSLTITDTAANVGACIDELQANGHVTSITLTDPADPVTVTATQYTADAAVIGVIGGTHSVIETGVTGQPYSSVQYNFSGGVLAGAEYFMASFSGGETLTGGSGQNTAMFTGNGSSYAVSGNATAATVTNEGTGAAATLTNIQTLEFAGGGDTILFSGTGDAVTLSATAGTADSVTGSNGSIYMNGAQSSVAGGADWIDFLGTGDTVSLSATAGSWDYVTGAGGTINLNGAQTSVAGGGDTVNFLGSSGNAASLYNTAGNWDYINGSGGTVYLTNAQTSVAGGGDTINFLGSSGNAASLYNTAGNWDYINGSGGTVYLTNAQTSVAGGGDTINFLGSLGNAASLYNTAGNWDYINGSGGTVYLTNAQTSVAGGGDTVNFLGSSGNAASLYNTAGNWDYINGSGGTVYLTNAQTSVAGGGDTVNFLGSSGNAASLYNTAGNWDYINGSAGTVYLTNAQTSVAGGGDTIDFLGSSGNAASLYNTAGNWDYINGSGGTVYLTNAQTSVAGGGDTVNFLGSSGNAASLYNTAGTADTINGSNGSIYLTGAQASVTGNSNTLNFLGTGNTASVSGSTDAFVFQAAFGQDAINGFASTDTMQLAASDFANWSALLGHMTQSGSNTLITLDAADTITLTGVAMSSLQQSQFKFA